METINIVFSSDNKYAQFMAVTLCSIFENKKCLNKIDIYILDGGIKDNDKDKLAGLEVRYNFKITYINVDTSFFKDFYVNNRMTSAAYFRTIIPKLLPCLEKILYLDCDIIITGDILELYKTNINNYFFAAVEDYGSGNIRLDELDMPPHAKYFNSGVMLINLKKWRENNICEKLINYIKKHPERLKLYDQDALNALMWNNYLTIPLKYNYTTSLLYKYNSNYNNVLKDNLVIHYAGDKPWNYFSKNPLNEAYFYYLKKTPWKDIKYIDLNIKTILGEIYLRTKKNIIINGKIKKILKSCISMFLYLLIKFNPKNNEAAKEKTLLIIKIDAIGDYILFRNFLKIIKESSKYKDYHITLLGNVVNKSIAETLDKNFVDNFIWINKRNIFKNPLSILKLIKLVSNKYKIAIQATFSREFIGDLLVKISGSETRIGFAGDHNNISEKEKNITDKWYTKLININPSINFEFYKNRSFFSQILGTNLTIKKPEIIIEDTGWNQPINIPDNFVILFPGSLVESKKWPSQNFKEVGSYLIEKNNLNVIICGSKSDNTAAKVITGTDSHIIDLTGKTSLTELIYIISKAKFVISNDTSGAHIAAALNIPVIVLSRYNHYMRFIPYPPEICYKMIFLFPNTFKELTENELIEKFKNGSNEDISLISVNQVKEAVKQFMI